MCNDRCSGPGAVLDKVFMPVVLPDRCIIGPDSAENRGIAVVAVPTVLVGVAASCSDKFSCSRDENSGRASDSVTDRVFST